MHCSAELIIPSDQTLPTPPPPSWTTESEAATATKCPNPFLPLPPSLRRASCEPDVSSSSLFFLPVLFQLGSPLSFGPKEGGGDTFSPLFFSGGKSCHFSKIPYTSTVSTTAAHTLAENLLKYDSLQGIQRSSSDRQIIAI